MPTRFNGMLEVATIPSLFFCARRQLLFARWRHAWTMGSSSGEILGLCQAWRKGPRRCPVKVTADGEIRFSGLTAADGVVHIANLPPGEYWLDADFLRIDAGSECFHISAHTSRKAGHRANYEWGDLAPAKLQSPRGRRHLRDNLARRRLVFT